MIIRMAKVEILGPKEDLLPVLELVRGRGIFQPDPTLLEGVPLPKEYRPRTMILDESELRERTFFENLKKRILALLELLPDLATAASPLQPLPVMDVLDELVDQHLASAGQLVADLNECQTACDDLEKDRLFWATLQPLLADLPDQSDLELMGITIRDAHQLDALEGLLQARTRGRFHLSTASTPDGTLVGLVATDHQMSELLRDALIEERVPELTLPEDLAGLSLVERIVALDQRLEGARQSCRDLQASLDKLSRQWLGIYRQALAWLEERLSLYQATAAVYATQQCFVINGWMAAAEVTGLRDVLTERFAGRVVLEELEILENDLDRVPVMLRNPGYFAPFEIFSRLLPLPKYTSYDPTPFIGLFFPVLFGMILGDVGYGLILLALAVFLAKRYPHNQLVCDLGKVLGVAAVYTVLFGLLYGELFGDLGEHWFGLHPVWIDRAKALLPMIIFALTVGVVHVLLGMLFGFWSDLRRHQRREALFKLLMLVAIILLVLALLGWWQPQPWLAVGPLLVSVGILLPVLVAAGGLLAPLELLKTLGNIISYVRIMAIGLSSVLLAVVANQLGGMTGDVLLGILVAGLLHSFNLLLGVFAPTVHALRLHYVEFFSKFLDLGGRRFDPWQKKP